MSSSENRTGREEILDYIGSVLDSLNAPQDGQAGNSDPKEKEPIITNTIYSDDE